MDPDDWEAAQKFCESLYLDGNCLEFAIAANNVTGWWPVLVVNDKGQWRHTAVCSNTYDPVNWKFFDARGHVDEQQLVEPFGDTSHFKIVSTTVEGLRRLRSVNGRSILRAAQFIEALWPDIPRIKGCRRDRISEFILRLEELCNEQGFYILGPTAESIFVSQLEGRTDVRYSVQPSLPGLSYIMKHSFRDLQDE